MAQVISFINMKGGVGKTTLAVNVGYALAYQHGKRVLLVDIDPQFNASTYLMTETQYLRHITDKAKCTVLDIFRPRKPAVISTVKGVLRSAKRSAPTLEEHIHSVFSGTGTLHLIPSILQLMEIEMAQRRTEDKLHNFIKQYAAKYDYVLIDCPPTISIFTQAAILASQSYVVPVKPDPLSTIGLSLLEKWLEDFTESCGLDVQPIGIVFCMVRSPYTKQMEAIMTDLREQRKEQVFLTHQTQSTIVAESVEAHKPVFLHSPLSKWAEEVRSIAQEFLTRTTGA